MSTTKGALYPGQLAQLCDDILWIGIMIVKPIPLSKYKK